MRAGGCAVQQTLTTEAASVLKHSLSLARRRGHGQVTPLHVAATLLSSRASLLRRACIKSQLPRGHQTSSHPLQCRALELCFNVALNRLPTSPGGGGGGGGDSGGVGIPLHHGHGHGHGHLSLSNALIAALKRAQAHQRRGCIEQQQQQLQQQPLLTIKVELEQLIISILDDPSVSRVMREAGFSSSAVKNNLEDDFSSSLSSSALMFQCYSSSSRAGGVFSSPCSPSPTTSPTTFWKSHFFNYSSSEQMQNPLLSFTKPQNKCTTSSVNNKEEFKLLMDLLMRKERKNTVIVGDSVSITEGLVSELMGRLERGDVPEELKSTHFFKFQFAPVSLRFMRREDVEMNLSHLKRKVDSVSSGEVIIYAGDLNWIIDSQSTITHGTSDHHGAGLYSTTDHLVSEMGKLLADYRSSSKKTKVWLMAAASYQTYMKCQMKQPPLEIQWSLQAVSVPSGGLGLSLHASSVHDPKEEMAEYKLNCCAECIANYEKEVALFSSGQQKHVPSWLQSKEFFVELRRKWNQSCHSLHYGKTHSAYASSHLWLPKQSSTVFPASDTISFVDSNNLPCLRRQHSCYFEICSGNNVTNKHQAVAVAEPRLDFLKNTDGKEVKITLALGNSSMPNARKLPEQRISDRMIHKGEICKMLLEENVPWQSETIPSIVEALVDSKSIKKDTWFLIQGKDFVGKRRLACAIAEAVCGSTDFLFQMNMRKCDNGVTTNSEILAGFLRIHEKLVVLVEDVDLADAQFMKFLANRYEAGQFGESSSEREEGTLFHQAIFILTTGDSMSYQDKLTNQNSVIQMKLQIMNYTNTNSMTLNSDHKRKAELDLSNSSKNPRTEDKKDGSSVTAENGGNKSNKKDLSRQSSFNTLDLNIKADELIEDKSGEYSPISSDLTTGNDLKNQHGFFLELIKNRFIFNCDTVEDSQMREVILSKIKGSFKELMGSEHMACISVEDMVLEELVIGSCSFLNGLLEKWLKDVFQTSLKTVNNGGKNGITVRLCFGGKGDRNMEGGGYMESCLPKNIQVSFMD